MTVKKTSYFLGIDSGGTKTEICLLNSDNLKPIKYSFPSIHYTVSGAEEFVNNLFSNLFAFLKKKKISIDQIKGITAGVAGARYPSDKNNIRKKILNLFNGIDILVTSDAHSALYSVFGDNDGFILISGTGSVLFGKVNGVMYRKGGWGKVLGDSGSGYSIALQALRKTVKCFDDPGVCYGKSLFIDKLDKKFGIKNSNIVEIIYRGNFDIQKLAPYVIESAQNGDKICHEIIISEIKELLLLLKNFKDNKGRYLVKELALSGGIFLNVFFKKLFIQNLITEYPFIKVLNKTPDPSFGAAIMAMKRIST